ncbi:hypothetical protein BN946_scf184999.g60 [Trametes cinnabarina]|uniref:Galactose oxidase n=1 Tax=Pycnoporus cinnabarinus TaxID=5643 RepID=A0A060SDS4_PYCCI|nr:hypothetical protein BN946_scf184999.g60 [Trametes cinnabarina]
MSTLSEVPEESPGHGPLTPNARSPYFHHSVTGSATTFKAATSTTSLASAASSSRTPSGRRTPSSLARSAAARSASGDTLNGGVSGMTTPKTQRSRSPATVKDRDRDRDRDDRSQSRQDREGNERDAAAGLRAHTVTLVDNVAWLFGGCDERTCWRDLFCFNTGRSETMQWTHPQVRGKIPKPCRAHSATLVDRKIFVVGGGEGLDYYNDVYVLDTVTREWHHPLSSDTPEAERTCPFPPPRRAHTSVFYKNKLWIFGGGNGTHALNDVWALDLSGGLDRLRWEEVHTHGKKPSERGYHTANLIGSVMVVVGGSDGKQCFSDIWCLNLDTLLWSLVKLGEHHRRLSHTATQVGSYLFIFGGHDGANYMQDLLLFNLVSLQYESRQIAGKPPIPRGYHAACLADSRVFIFGGFNGVEVFDDVHILDLAGAAYLPQVTSFLIDVE